MSTLTSWGPAGVLGDVAAGGALHLKLLLRRPLELITLATTPLITLTLAAVVGNADQPDLLAPVIVGSGLMGLWVMLLGEASEMISADRAWGTMLPLLACPASLRAIVTGRLLASTVVGSISGLEALAVGVAVGVRWRVDHPVVLAVGGVLTVAALVATGALLSTVFLVSRVGMLFEIVLVYPFYILGAVAFPVTVLPGWAQLLSNAVFLRWSVDLVRDGLGAGAAGLGAGSSVAVLGALVVVTAAAGAALLRRTEDRLRRLGSSDQL